MHEHHHSDGLNLLPLWGSLFWVPLLAAVCALQVVHMLWMRGGSRRFHLVHLLIGIGMVYMFAPWTTMPLDPDVPIAFYSGLTVLVGGWVGLELQRVRRVNLLWVLATVECAAMAYMFAVHHGTAEIPELSRVLVAFYLLLVAAWMHGWFAEPAPGRRASVLPYDFGPGQVPARQLCCKGRWDFAAAEAAMSLAMAYMFLGMDSGARGFFATAFTTGKLTEESLWAICLIALAVLAVVPARRSTPTPDTNTPRGHKLTETRAGGGR